MNQIHTTASIDTVTMIANGMTSGSSNPKRLNRTRDASQDRSDKTQWHGTPGQWKIIFKAWNKRQGWMKATKALQLDALGVLVQVTTQQGDQVAEALQYIPGAALADNDDGTVRVVADTHIYGGGQLS